jgi:hypothetical protein
MSETVVTIFLLGALCVAVAGMVLYALSEVWFWMDEQERKDR